MAIKERVDDYTWRKESLKELDDGELHEEFWKLVNQVVDPMVEEARTHTTPSIERSLLLRMGFDSSESARLVKRMEELNLLGHGAGHLVLKLARTKGLRVREAGLALLDGRHWDELV
ncbi:MAG: D-ornithine 4,5-aminomutase subunit OraS [Candidatus Sedimenticola sp. (ex Thyasira tokunagai)]